MPLVCVPLALAHPNRVFCVSVSVPVSACVPGLRGWCRAVVRGLALRSLCSLRLPNIIEYIMGPMRAGLIDPAPYVRKTAVSGCAKIFAMLPGAIKDSDLVDVLYNMLRDKDAQVITNAMVALNEILRSEGGMAVNRQIVIYLLSRLKEFSEWGQCTILELVVRYPPATSDEMFEIMNVLEDRLQHSNAAVVLSATKVLLQLTRTNAKLHSSVYSRLKGTASGVVRPLPPVCFGLF